MRKQSSPEESGDLTPADLAGGTSHVGGRSPRADNEDVVPQRESPNSLTVIGLGGSAGSIPALERFFQNVSEETNSAYVVVIHLSPGHESHLATLLGRATALPVQQVDEPVKVEGRNVYVIPPGKQLEMNDGMLTLRPLDKERGGTRIAIDVFFRTLSEAHGPQAAAIVFSGNGADGTLGIRYVKEAGGLAVAQSPGEAEYDSMPRNAIASGMIDYVLPAASMPAQIESYWATSRRMRLPEEAAPDRNQQVEGPDQEAAFANILSHVRAQTGHDFALYKRATVLRRIGRRMQVNTIDSLPAYLDFLRTHPAEVVDLVNDLLISVTQFFRDPEAWEALARDTVPRLFRERGPDDDVRVWVCGCATGEEAYTLGMLMLERAEAMERPPRIQIFATDMDADAIARARSAIYPDTIAGDVTEERLRRWFYRQPGSYQVRKELRECVLFATHDVLRDTPFSRLDLVTCRNMLIYLNREAQERVFTTFHFALKPEGRMMLGPSESADGSITLFSVMDKTNRIYIRRPVTRGGLPPIPAAVTLSTSSVRTTGALSPARWVMGRDFSLQAPSTPAVPLAQRPVTGGRELLLSLLERYGPATALVDETYDIIHLSGGAGRFLRVADGEPTRNLLLLVRPELRIELRTCLYAASQEKADQVRIVHEPSSGNGEISGIRITVRPVFDTPESIQPYFMVLLEEMATDTSGGKTPASSTASPEGAAALQSDLARRLEEEIATLQRQLRSTIEQYEAITEELKASNEELQAMNEEQRSAAEELETSKEELQSVNEELSTVNHELRVRVDEVSRTNSDLQNFLASTDIGTLFLDRELRIKRYTPAAESLFNLIPSDAGRPLSHITNKLAYPELLEDAETVLARLSPVEREVTSVDGVRYYLVRLLPYRSLDDRIEGVVLNVLNITERRQAEQRHRQTESQMRLIVDSAKEFAIFTLDMDRRVESWNSGAAAMLGYSAAEIAGQMGDIIFVPEDVAQGAPAQETETALAAGQAENERWHLRKDGNRIYGSGLMMVLRDDAGRAIGFVKIMRDLTERKRAEEELAHANELLEKRVQERTAQLEAMGNARQELLRQLVDAQEVERARISRELHDQMGQHLTGFLLGMDALKAAQSPGSEQAVLAERLGTAAAELSQEVHRMAWDLRPPALDDVGLAATLVSYVEEWQQRHGIVVDIHSRNVDSEHRLPPEIETAFYRIVQEALTNVARHAKGSKSVNIVLEQMDGTAQLLIEDDGGGFDVRTLGETERLGLRGVQERAALLHGTMEIESVPGKGTTVFVGIPLQPFPGVLKTD